MPKTPKNPGIEAQLKSLEEIVEKIEDGSLPIEESLALFEEGIRLSRQVQSSLESASMKVTRLLEGEGAKEVPLDLGPEGDPSP